MGDINLKVIELYILQKLFPFIILKNYFFSDSIFEGHWDF